ncbi:unnamed protein product [Rhizoctonia solani]|uniref:Uncharacterized protein n=1 Tax=Rhizoctonia solani TaxID=456999 RepID=A0A8H3H261_9AGAM|nr:unnamed protein product [Rhizoctonia solani]
MQDTLHTRPRAATPLLPISNINHDPPRTPPRVVQQNPPSSPTDFPSPGRLISSLGFGAPRDPPNAPIPGRGPTTLSNVDGFETRTPIDTPPAFAHPNEAGGSHPTVEADMSQVYGEESPMRSQSSSQTVVPSSQPIHDSTPPPEYDIDPKRHSFNQGRLQSFTQPPVTPAQPLALFDSRFPSNSSRPFFTAPTHQSSPHSSQSLPPSQSPIKGGRVDPNQSAAGMRAVFGMLGFGSEAEAQTEVYQGDTDEETDPHIPVTCDLPPSSPPPQTPTRYESRESSPDSYLIPVSGQKGKAKSRIGKTPIRDSPLIRAFEAAKKRSKTATPSAIRRHTPKVNQIASSPVRPAHLDDMDIDSSPVRDSQNSSKGPTHKASKARAELGGAQTATSSARLRRTFQATPSKDSQGTRQSRLSTRSQRQKSVDNEIVESSDAEEMEVDILSSPVLPTSTRATAGARRSTEPTKPSTPRRNRPPIRTWDELENREHAPSTPVREERLPSSVSPSPIRIHDSPPAWHTRSSSPPSENTQTQEEAETPWESLRPSQSVSQVYERQLIEEAQRERRLRMEQNAEKQKGKTLVEESPDMVEDEQAKMDKGEPLQRQESLDQEPVRPVMISLNPRSPTNVPNEPPRLALPRSLSTPKTQRAAEKAHYIVTPTKVTKRTPARTTPSRKSMTPSSMTEGNDEEYTYVEETFNPTDSQMSFLNRILQRNNSEMS